MHPTRAGLNVRHFSLTHHFLLVVLASLRPRVPILLALLLVIILLELVRLPHLTPQLVLDLSLLQLALRQHVVLLGDFRFQLSEDLIIFNSHLGHFLDGVRNGQRVQMIQLKCEDWGGCEQRSF